MTTLTPSTWLCGKWRLFPVTRKSALLLESASNELVIIWIGANHLFQFLRIDHERCGEDELKERPRIDSWPRGVQLPADSLVLGIDLGRRLRGKEEQSVFSFQ